MARKKTLVERMEDIEELHNLLERYSDAEDSDRRLKNVVRGEYADWIGGLSEKWCNAPQSSKNKLSRLYHDVMRGKFD